MFFKKKVTSNQVGAILYYFIAEGISKEVDRYYGDLSKYGKINRDDLCFEIICFYGFSMYFTIVTYYNASKIFEAVYHGFINNMRLNFEERGLPEDKINSAINYFQERVLQYFNIFTEAKSGADMAKAGHLVLNNLCGFEVADPVISTMLLVRNDLMKKHLCEVLDGLKVTVVS